MNLRTDAKLALRRALHRCGLDLVRFVEDRDLLMRRMRLLERHAIDVIVDVGANAGQFAQILRAAGYRGRIVSFEPLPDAYRALQAASSADASWDTVNVALGDHAGEITINVSGNSQSSSVLSMLPSHLGAAPDSGYVGMATVPMTTLSSVIDTYVAPGQNVFVKIDTQGYERQILEGATDRLDRISGFQLELSLTALYEGQALIEELIAYLRRLGFAPASMEPDFWDERSGQLLQADGVFFRQARDLGRSGSVR